MNTRAPSAGELEAVIRDCFGAEMVDSVRERLVWPGPDIASDEAPDHLLVILFASRAGSTFAGQLLARTPHFNRVAESFNAPQLQRLRKQHGLADTAETLRWAIGKFGTPQAFAAKCGVPGLVGAFETGFLEATFPRLNFVLLDRRDRVAQAVSLYRAERTGRFHAMQESRRKAEPDDYDREAIAERLAVIDRVYELLRDFLSRTGKPAETCWYEDIVEDPRGFVDSVCDGMGLDRPAKFAPKTRTRKLADDISADWIARFRAGD